MNNRIKKRKNKPMMGKSTLSAKEMRLDEYFTLDMTKDQSKNQFVDELKDQYVDQLPQFEKPEMLSKEVQAVAHMVRDSPLMSWAGKSF